MTYLYLAVPYSPVGISTESMKRHIREDRYYAACKAAAHLMKQGEVTYSPISHSHGIDLFFDAPESGEFWEVQDRPFLEGCAKLVVLTLPGWSLSKGVEHEIRTAESLGIPVVYMDPL